MPRYSPTTKGLTPGVRVGAGPTSKVLLDANDARSFVWLFVNHETAEVAVALGEEATLGEAPVIQKSDGLIQLTGYRGALSAITSTEGANEKQKVTLSEATGGTFTLTFEGKTTVALAFNATKEVVQEKLEALTTIGAGNVAVTGEAGGPYTVEFKEDLKATDVPQMTADGSKLEAAEEAVASVAVTTDTAGGVPVLIAEG